MVVALSQSTADGLSKDARMSLQQCRDCANQILKTALAINGSVLAEMEIPSSYLDTLPKVQVSISMPRERKRERRKERE